MRGPGSHISYEKIKILSHHGGCGKAVLHETLSNVQTILPQECQHLQAPYTLRCEARPGIGKRPLDLHTSNDSSCSATQDESDIWEWEARSEANGLQRHTQIAPWSQDSDMQWSPKGLLSWRIPCPVNSPRQFVMKTSRALASAIMSAGFTCQWVLLLLVAPIIGDSVQWLDTAHLAR